MWKNNTGKSAKYTSDFNKGYVCQKKLLTGTGDKTIETKRGFEIGMIDFRLTFSKIS